MLLPKAALDGIADGSVTCAYRAWLRPTVRAGGTLNTRVGQLAIDAVEVVDPATITDDDARAAGAASAAEVVASLRAGEGRVVYRIDFHLAGDDPRVALRAAADLDAVTLDDLRLRLARMDQRAPDGPWTRRYLELIRDRPGQVARELAPRVGMERDDFKVRVRRLKSLGLTESLAIGYRLAPRGEALLAALADADG